MRIDVAYCIELDQVVDIHKACQEFAAQDKLTRFHFLCSDPICRKSKEDGVRVSGVNHYKLPEEQEVSPHYRVLDNHIADCDWMELGAALADAESSLDTEESTAQRRKLLRKIKRLITCFVIPEEVENGDQDEINNELEHIRNDKDRSSRRKKLLAYARGTGSTATSLETLVSCYEELKEEGALDEEFTIKGYGTISFRRAFRQITYGVTKGFVVYHGGARLNKRYGSGFALNFMDKHQEMPVSFYVSPEHLKNYRPSARLKRIVDELEKNIDRRPYLRVYWIGNLERTEKGYSATFITLAHVVLRLVYPVVNT